MLVVSRHLRDGGCTRVCAVLVSISVGLLAGCAMAADGASQCELSVAWDSYEPYSFSTGDDRPVGYDIDVVTKVAELVDCSLTFTQMPWDDVLVALRNGDADVALGTGYKAARAKWSWYTESYRKEVIGLLVRAGDSEHLAAATLDELFEQGFVFGRTTGDSYGDGMEAALVRHAGLVRAPVTESENLGRLLDKSIDGFLIEIYVAAALARKSGATGAIERHPLEFTAGDYRLQLSRKTVPAALVARLDAAIQQLAASGWLESMIESYGID